VPISENIIAKLAAIGYLGQAEREKSLFFIVALIIRPIGSRSFLKYG
jgi:hypothetical protein